MVGLFSDANFRDFFLYIPIILSLFLLKHVYNKKQEPFCKQKVTLRNETFFRIRCHKMQASAFFTVTGVFDNNISNIYQVS